jgi:hypothetical protein
MHNLCLVFTVDNTVNTHAATTEGLWFLDHTKPNTTALDNLDGEEGCKIMAYQNATATTPLSGASWSVPCDDGVQVFPITITPVCTATASYVYEWGEWVPEEVRIPCSLFLGIDACLSRFLM